MPNPKLFAIATSCLLIVLGIAAYFLNENVPGEELVSTRIPVEATGDYETGVNAAFAGDFDTAFSEFLYAAEEGSPLAQYNLAILYFTGRGVETDFEQAFRWTEAAAEQGHLNAQFNLGSLYFEGQGTRQNNVLGVDWFKQAARSGHPDAAYALAKMHQEGDPVSRNLVEAHAWAAKAANNEHPEGNSLKEEITQTLSSSELSEARRLFASWQLDALPSVVPGR